MIVKLVTDLKITCLEDLTKYKALIEEGVVKINKSAKARELGVDRRTIAKYLKGYQKPKHKKKKFKLDYYEKTIRELLSDDKQKFYYVSFLYRYLIDNYGLNCSESTFRYYIYKHDEFNDYFKSGKKVSNANQATLMFETGLGKQAQIDRKESIKFHTSEGEVIIVNIFSFILANSRFRLYFLSIDKNRTILLHFLTRSFELIGGVPQELLCDNMTTIMDEARTEDYSGQINKEAEEFAKQFGFEFHPCVAGRPQTKAKVESIMRILDEIRCYSGKLTLEQLQIKLVDINNRENSRFHSSYNKVPILAFEKEKGYLLPLPPAEIRSQYKIKTTLVAVGPRSLVRIDKHEYSVPPEYCGKKVEYQIVNGTIFLYYNTRLIRMHKVSKKPINYEIEDYKGIVKLYNMFDKDDEIAAYAKQRLKEIDESYGISNDV